MKTSRYVLSTLIAASVALSQQRVVLTPDGEAVPVGRGQSALELIKKSARVEPEEPAVSPPCPGRVPIGVVPGTPTVNFGFNYGDVAAMIYTSPYEGAIESVYFMSFGSVAIPDSTAFLRIMGANTSGIPATTWMGYCIDTNAISCDTPPLYMTAFPDEATGPCSGTIPITENEMWGLGGAPVTWHTGTTVTGVRMMDLGYEPQVTAGDSFAICIRVPNCPNTGTSRNEMSGTTGSGQGRFFKYYHGQRLGTGDYGWWSRADYDMFIWVVMRPTGSLPPIITFETVLHHTLSTQPREVCFSAIPCDTTSVDSTIAHAELIYRVDTGPWDTASFVNSDSGRWCAEIPGEPAGSTVTYFMLIVLPDSSHIQTGPRSYYVVGLSRDGYETTLPPSGFIDITSTGTAIAPADFFPDGNYDDGTAGPLSLDGTFRFFNQDVTHAWVGANGALALSASATDTINVNSGGFFSNWTIPQSGIARNFVAAFWNDFYLGPGGHGTVYYETSGSQFIVEYYRVGNFNSAADTTTTFEIILDRSDSSVTFQYADVGVTGLDSSDLVGLQSDTPEHGWLFLNRFGYPDTTRPRSGLAIRMKYTGVLSVPGKQNVPEAFALFPNYPNPFNPVTVIRYSLPVGQDGILSYHVSLKVYNLLGQEVATLVSDTKQPGTYAVTWDAIGLSSGVYFCRLQAGKFIDTKKLVLIK